jgi:hypothetical protein
MPEEKGSSMPKNILKPCSVQMAITYRCNLKCLHCDIWKNGGTKELKPAQWIKAAGKLRKWLGPFRLDISGGEPFLRKDIFDIVDFCDNNDIQVVVTTNATLLSQEYIRKISHIKGLTLNVSLEGINPSTHDYLRNVKGTYDKVMDVFLGLKKSDRVCHVTMATILMGYNIEEIMPLIKKLIVDRLADAINFQALDHNFQAPYRNDWFDRSDLWPDRVNKRDFLSILDGIIRIKKAGAPIYNPVRQLEAMREYFNDPEKSIDAECNTGNTNFIMNPNGDVHLCWNMAPVGNILDEDPADIWNSENAKKRRKQISLCSRTCRILNCNFND